MDGGREKDGGGGEEEQRVGGSQGGVTPMSPFRHFRPAVLTVLTTKFRGRGHVFLWANAFVGQAKANLRLQ